MDQSFDPNLPALLEGEVGTVLVVDPTTFPPPEVGNLVVDPTRAFQIKITWKVFGFLTPLWFAALGGSWDVSAFAESIGAGPEVRLGSASVPVTSFTACTTGVNCRQYEATIDVQPNTITEDVPGTDASGIYKIVLAVFLDSNLGSPGFDLVGFSEGPIIRAENPQ